MFIFQESNSEMTRKMIKTASSMTKISSWKSFNTESPNTITTSQKKSNKTTYTPYHVEKVETIGSMSKIKDVIIPNTFGRIIVMWKKITRDFGVVKKNKESLQVVEWGYFVDLENLQGQHFHVSPLSQVRPKLNPIKENGSDYVKKYDSDENLNQPFLIQLYDTGIIYTLFTVLSIKNKSSFLSKGVILALGLMTLTFGGYNILIKNQNQGLH